nr:hypothetical protein [Lachnospiraceae bacterium]
EKYESDKDGHTRKDYKYKDMSDKENRSIIWGILFALENEPDSCDVQPTPSYFKKPDYCRQDLITDIDYYGLSLNDMKRYDPVDLWGETWYYDSTLE